MISDGDRRALTPGWMGASRPFRSVVQPRPRPRPTTRLLHCLRFAILMLVTVGCSRSRCAEAPAECIGESPVVDSTETSPIASRTRLVRWRTSSRPSFDMSVAQQSEGTIAVCPDGNFELGFLRSIAPPFDVSLSLLVGGRWMPLESANLPTDELRDAWVRRQRSSTVARMDRFINCRIVSIRDLRRSEVGWKAETRPIPRASLRLKAHSVGAPGRGDPELVSDSDGVIRYGPIVDDEWYGDVFASDHCPVRALLSLSDGQDGPERFEIPLFPSRARRGQVLVHRSPPPPATTLMVDVQAPGFMEQPTYYRLDASGRFDVNEPMAGDVVYTVTLPDGRSRSVRKGDLPNDGDFVIEVETAPAAPAEGGHDGSGVPR